jgi:phosphonate transport system substrate-binding protein
MKRESAGSRRPAAPRADALRVAIVVPLAGPASASTTRLAMATANKLHAFCNALCARTGIVASPQTYVDYQALLDAMKAGKADLAWLPPVVAARSMDEGSSEPVAFPARHGLATFHAALFAPADSPVRTLGELRAVRAAWVDPQSAAGYLVIRAELAARGIDLARAFHEERFFGGHAEVVEAVLGGEADVGATFAHLDTAGAVVRAGWGDAPVHVVALAGPVPPDAISVGARVSGPLLREVRRALVEDLGGELQQACRDLFDAERFLPARSELVGALERLAIELGRASR